MTAIIDKNLKTLIEKTIIVGFYPSLFAPHVMEDLNTTPGATTFSRMTLRITHSA